MQRFETKFDLLNAAYKDEKLKKGAILLLQYLVHKSNKEKCFPAVDTIAKALNVCKRTVQYNMRKLENAGYIIRKDRWYNHQQLTNQYVFNLGVTEDVSDVIRYTDSEKENIHTSLFTNQEKCSEVGQVAFNKSEGILKVYNMPLSSREKLLLTYMFHKANKKGLCYKSVTAIMKEIGVGRRTLVKLLNCLRSKNLIKVKTIFVSGQETLLVKLTGNIYIEQKSEVASRVIKVLRGVREQQQNAQSVESDQTEETVFYGQNIQSSHGCGIRKKQFWKNIWRKYKGMIQLGLDTIRRILRL